MGGSGADLMRDPHGGCRRRQIQEAAVWIDEGGDGGHGGAGPECYASGAG